MICFKDTVKLVETSAPDGYGDIEPIVLTDLKCLFSQNTGHGHSNNVDVVNSDAHAYIDFENPEVVSRAYRLEGMYIIANPFNAVDSESWYRITKVIVGQAKLTSNKIDNVHIYLKKSEAL
jgi:hypothetical protein